MVHFRTAMMAVAVAAAMAGSQALAADISLAPGKPAGVRSAQAMNVGSNLLLIGAAAAVAVVAVVVATQSDSNTPCGTTCTGTSTSTGP